MFNLGQGFGFWVLGLGLDLIICQEVNDECWKTPLLGSLSMGGGKCPCWVKLA